MMPRLRIGFVITALGVGGAEHALLKLLSLLDKTRFEPSLVVLGQQDDLLPQFQAIGIEPVMLRLRPGRWPFAELGRFLAVMRNLRVDILQGWMYHGNLAASFAAARLHPAPRVCWSVRDTPDSAHAHSVFTRLVIRASSYYLGRVARIFNVSARSAQYCARELGWPLERTEVLPNGVDSAVFCPDLERRSTFRQRLGVADNVILIGMVARWSPVKNHALFLSALSQLRRDMPNVEAVLVGKGLDENNPELMALLSRYDLHDCCHLLGPCDKVETLYPAFEMLALSSRSEGFPNVLVEAMSCAVPVVSTDVGDAIDIVGDTGYVVAQDSDAMATALRKLCEPAHARRLGLAARARVVERYSLAAIVAKLQAQYEVLCGRI